MSIHRVLYTEGRVKLKLEDRDKVRPKFRHFSREVCREVFDIPEDNQVIFSYEKNGSTSKVFQTGQLTFTLADLRMQEPGIPFDTEYFPQVTFMFVHRDFQCQGYGKLLIKEALKIIKTHCDCRPVRLKSAQSAVGFFEKCGFKVVAEPYDCWHSGAGLFRTLVDMEHTE